MCKYEQEIKQEKTNCNQAEEATASRTKTCIRWYEYTECH